MKNSFFIVFLRCKNGAFKHHPNGQCLDETGTENRKTNHCKNHNSRKMEDKIVSSKDEIVLYQPNAEIKLEVRLEEETVWLNLNQLALLFNRDKSVISRHISSIYKEQELDKGATIAKNATVQNENGRSVIRQIEYYNLDVIISVGYRVKSKQGTLFRQWANKVLKDHLLKGYTFNQRMERLEQRVTETENKIDFFVKTALPPVEGIFYDGNVLESFGFVNNLIRSAKKRIVLIDNYVDETVLLRLAERSKGIKAIVFSRQLSPSFKLALQQHNQQYEKIEVKQFDKSHDRFLIIDATVYHIGASIKDLGKKWFAFCKMNISADEIIGRIR